MKKIYFHFILFLSLLLPLSGFATHIVGGSITYTYNGGTNYTVMLKLYRDCSGAAFPASATIDVLMANGSAFAPSRNFTLPGGAITNITPVLPPCATAPNPVPCVEERVYTGTVSLAAHPGGMHLVYDLCCRNGSISNILNPGAEGETFYAYIPCYNKAWSEDFTLPNGTTTDAGATAWTRTLGAVPPTSAQVNNGMFEIVGSNNGSMIWASQVINISTFAAGVNLSANLERIGTNFGNNDTLKLFYSINGGPKTLWTVNGNNVGAWASPRFATANALVGNTIQLYIHARFNANNNSTGKTFRVDMVNVYNNTFVNNSSPYFNALPPLLLCATNPFSLNMSATDADGDVLVYSMYTPYDDNPFPTYPNNLFTPSTVTWSPGYSAVSPFNSGGPNVTLNASTGLMTGVANTLGQYVYGVKVQEFRGGILLSEVTRDYQVNTVTCPPFVPAAPIASANSPICAGQTLSLSATFTAGATYQWTGPNGFTSTLVNPTIPGATTLAAGVYSVTATVAGCTSPPGTVAVVVNPVPTTPTATANSPICAGQTLSLFSSTVTGATYNWTGPNAFTSTLQNPTIAGATTLAAGVYSVTSTVSGCTSGAGTVNVVVNPLPASPTAGANTPLCAGQTLNLTASTIAGATYIWAGPNSFTSTTQNPSIPATTTLAAGVYSVSAVVAGCPGLPGTVSVTINPAPAAPTAGSNSPLCAGNTINLTASTIAGATYSWTGPNGFTSTLQNPSIPAASTLAAGVYSVTATVAGCPGPAGTTSVTVNPTPAAPTAGGTATLCAGGTINLTASAIAGATYNWTGPNSFTSNVQNPTIPGASTLATGMYSVTATVAGCTGPAGTFSVTVFGIPGAPVLSSNSPICAGQTLSLTASTIVGASYNWTGPNAFTSTLQNPTIAAATTAASGTYSVSVNVSGCGSAASTLAVVVNPTPAAPTAGSNSPLCAGQTINLTASNIAGATYNWSGPNAFTSTTQNPTIPGASTLAAGVYSVNATVSGCTSANGTVNVVVNPIPAAPTPGSNSPICVGQTLNLTASTVTGATYSWSGPNAFASALQNPSIANAQVTNSGTYSLTSTVAGCTSTVVTINVTISPLPAAPVASANSPLCAGQTLSLSASTVAGATYTWTGPSSFTANIQNPTITNATLTASGVYSVSANVAGCAGPAGTVAVTVNPAPAAPTAGGTATLCAGGTINLTASNIAGATYNWTGPNGFTSTTQNPSIPGASTLATGMYSVTATVAGCPGPAGTFSVTVFGVPGAPTLSSNSPVCAGQTLSLTANTIVGASYNWSGPNSFTSTLQNPTIAAATTAASGTYSVLVNVSGCGSAVSTIAVTVNPTPAAPTAGSNSPLCAGSTINLTASTIAGATYNWSGPNSFTSTTQNPTIPGATTLSAGIYSVNATVAGCTGSNGTVNVVVNPIPASPTANSNSPLCVGQTINLTASTVTGATYNWSGPNGFTSTLQNPTIPGATTLAAGVYSVTSTVAGCTSSVSVVTVSVNIPPVAPTAAANSPICAGQTLSLTASTIAGATYSWTGPASFTSNIQNPTIPSATTSATGTYTVFALVGGCAGPTSTVAVTINPAPAAPVASGTSTLCAGSNINLSASTIAGATYNWTGPNGFTSSVQNPTITAATTSATGVYSVNATVAGCPGPAGTVSVTVYGIPGTPSLTSNSPVCAGQTLSLTANTILGATYNWSGPNSFTAAVQNPTLSNVTAAAAGNYSVSISVMGCGSAVSTIAVSILPTPAAPTAGSNSPICDGQTINLTASTIAGASYNWSGPNSFTSTTQNPSIPSASTTASGIYSVNVTVAGCTGPSGTVNVVVNPIPASPTITSNSPLCVGQTLSLTAGTITGATYNWSGPNSFTSAVQNPTVGSITTAAAGIYSVTATVAGCTGSAGTVSVSVNIPPGAPTASANSPLCALQTLSLSAGTIAGATYSWTGPASFTSTSQNPSIPSVTTTASGTYSVVALVGGCAGPAGTVAVTVNPAPAAPTAGGTATLCAGSDINLTASSITGATYSWTGPNSFTSSVQNPTITAATTSATGVYSVNATVAGCTGPAGTVSVTVYGIPGPPTLGSNSPVCAGQTLSLTANSILGATYVWSGPNSFTSAVQNPTLSGVTLSASGNYSVAISVMGCGSAFATTAVTVNPLPAAPVANSNSPLCSGDTLFLSASTVAGATYSWTGPNTFTSTTQNPNIPNTTTLSAGVYSVSAVALGCAGPTGTVNVAVNNIPNIVATSNSTICIGATLSLSATPISGATYTWSGPNSFTSTTQNPTITGATALANGIYSVQANVGGCIGPVTTTSVTVSPPPAPPTASSSSPLCAGDTLFLTASPVAGATYTWSGPNSFTATTQNPNVPNIPMAGAGVYSVAVTVAGCQGPFGTITVTVNPTPAPPVASNSSPICISGTLNLTASTIAGATYSWTGPNSFTSTTQNPTLPGATTVAAGAYSVTATVAGCTSTAAITIATITMPATLSAGNNATVCSNSVPLTGTCSTGSGTWTTSGSGVFFPNSLTGNYVPSAADITAGTVTLTLTSTNNGACAPATSTVQLSILPGPTANAGSDITVCANNATVALTGSVTLASGGLWTSSGTGTFSPNNTNLNTNYIPSNADTTAGSVTIYLTTTGNGICSATIDSLVINFNSAPLVVAGGTVSVCKNNPVAVLSGYSSTGSATWTSLGSGTLSSTSVLNPTYTPSTADTTAGSVQLILTSTNNGNCNAVSDTVTIVYSSPPTISAGLTQTVCSNNAAVTLNGISSTTSGTWTTSGSGTFSPNTINGTYIPSASDISTGSVTLTVTSTNNGGCNAVTSTVNISIIPGPTADAGTDLTVCANTTSIALNGSVTVATGGTWTTNGSGTFTPGNSLTTTYVPSAADTTAGSVTIYLTTTGNGICLQEVDSMVINFISAPTVDAGNTIFACKNNTSVNLNASTAVSTVTWTTLGSGTFNPNNNILNPTYTPSTADTTAGNVTLVVNTGAAGVCAGVSDTVKIFFQNKPLANFVANNRCVNAATTFTDMSTAGTSTIVSWNWDFGAAGTSTLQNPSVTFTATGTQTVSLTVSTGCRDSVVKTVYINPNPTASFTFNELCHDSAAFFGIASVTPGSIANWSWNFGDTTSSNIQNPIHVYQDTGSYIVTLTVQSDSGCVASALDTIHLKKCGNDVLVTNPAVPSGFTPNGDGKNDVLYVKGGPFEELNFRIFNEWGNEIFISTIQSSGWDGTFKSAAQAAGRYIWTLTGKLVDGREVNMSGEVILSR